MFIQTDMLLVALVLANLTLLASSRMAVCIRAVAVQGVILGFFPILAHLHEITARLIGLGVVFVTMKGIVFPWLLFRALRDVGVRREVEPLVGWGVSILAGTLALAVSLWLGARLPLPAPTFSPLVVPVALFTLFIGLFVIVSRRKALSQVLGYLVLENGIYAFGVAVAGEIPALVELGVLLDAFVAVFVMGIAMYQITREFDHIDVDRLSTLKG